MTYLAGWQASGATAALHDELREQCRIAAGRDPGPTAAVIDSQSVKAAETVAKASHGFDAGKKINGRKRHIAVDVMGLLLVIVVTAASVQDRDGARALLWRLRACFRAVTLVWARLSEHHATMVYWSMISHQDAAARSPAARCRARPRQSRTRLSYRPHRVRTGS